MNSDEYRTHLRTLTVSQLKDIVRAINAKTRIIYSKLRKHELVETIVKHSDMLNPKKIYTKGWAVKGGGAGPSRMGSAPITMPPVVPIPRPMGPWSIRGSHSRSSTHVF